MGERNSPEDYVCAPGSGPFYSQLILTYTIFLDFVFYFALGFFIAQHYEAMKQKIGKLSLKSISLVVLVSAVFYTFVYYHPGVSNPVLSNAWLFSVTGPFYGLILIPFYLRISTTWGEPRGALRYLEKIGEDSFGIYLIQLFCGGGWLGAFQARIESV